MLLISCGTATKQHYNRGVSAITQNSAFNKLLHEVDNIQAELEPSDKPYFFYITLKEVDGEKLMSILATLLRPWIMHPEQFSGYFVYNGAYLFFLSDDNNKIQQHYRQGVIFNKDAAPFPRLPIDNYDINDGFDYIPLRFYRIDNNDNLVRLEWSEDLVQKMREK